MQGRALILMYHRVCDPREGVQDYSPNGMSVTPREFRMQMQFIRQNYDVVPLGRLVDAVRGEAEFTPGMCAVTFDDGWRDIYVHALPVLRDLSIAATVFLTAGFTAGQIWFWEERAKYLLALIHGHPPDQTSRLASEVREQLAGFGLDDLVLVRRRHLPRYLAEAGRRVKQLDTSRREQLMSTLESLAARLAPDEPRAFLDASEVREMARDGIEFGNHTDSHPNLTELGVDDLRREIVGAADRIRQLAGGVPEHFAYPYGKYDRRVRDEVQALGARSACTTRLGLVERDSDPFALNRVNMCSPVAGREPLFAARILGF
jgi:peptidoglycan/xylan/chitin deacetylase (PgdA/CDA1 family)